MVDYKRIYQAKVRDMSYKGIRTTDAPDDIGKVTDKVAKRMENFVTSAISEFRGEDKAVQQELRQTASQRGYYVSTFMKAFKL